MFLREILEDSDEWGKYYDGITIIITLLIVLKLLLLKNSPMIYRGGWL